MRNRDKWAPTPKHLLRKNCVRDVIKGFKPGRFVEMGAGTGDFTSLFLSSGYEGVCYDLGIENRAILRHNLAKYKNALKIVDNTDEIPRSSFEYLFAFEVLEHIVDDARMLKAWASFLKPGGIALISVPAHMSAFGPSDERVGHVRRYEKDGLAALLKESGFHDIEIFNWGVPLGNITRRISGLLQNSPGNKGMSQEDRSIWSGRERTRTERVSSTLANRFSLYPFFLLQRLFYSKDYGDGYVLTAKLLG